MVTARVCGSGMQLVGASQDRLTCSYLHLHLRLHQHQQLPFAGNLRPCPDLTLLSNNHDHFVAPLPFILFLAIE